MLINIMLAVSALILAALGLAGGAAFGTPAAGLGMAFLIYVVVTPIFLQRRFQNNLDEIKTQHKREISAISDEARIYIDRLHHLLGKQSGDMCGEASRVQSMLADAIETLISSFTDLHNLLKNQQSIANDLTQNYRNDRSNAAGTFQDFVE